MAPKDDGRFEVAVSVSGEERNFTARSAVILATGGFGANPAMRQRLIPMAASGWSLQPEGNEGDGIRIACELGGRLVEDNEANAIGVPVSADPGRQPAGLFPHLPIDRHAPGSIVVDADGKRFVNEASHYQHFVETMHRRGVDRAFLVGDARFRRKYGIGLVRPWPFSDRAFLRSGYLKRSRTIAGLAHVLQIDPGVLEHTIERFNATAADGVDLDFGRGHDRYSRAMGDPTHRPNPCLAPLVKPPFYAIELRPGDLSTLAGIATDEKARVLDAENEPIAGLYAVGADMNSIFGGRYPGGGTSLGPAMTFAFIAANDIADGASAGTRTLVAAPAAQSGDQP